MNFNIQAAKKAGYTDQEIQAYLQQQNKSNLLNNGMQLAGGVLGGIAGGAVGVAGGALIPGADLTGVPEALGGYAGGVAGAGAGAGIGNAGADWIRQNLLGDKTVQPNQTMNNSVEAAKEGAAGQAIGVPAAKGLGFLAHPIAPFIGKVDSLLAKSNKNIDISDLLTKYKENVLPEQMRKGVGQDAIKAANKLSADMTGATAAFNQTPAAGDLAGLDMTLPLASANQLKRNVTGSIKDFYGQPTQNADINARKAFASQLKDAIAKAEPGVKVPNAIASALYKVPQVAQGLTQILGLGNPQAARAIQMIGGLPTAATQKAITPSGGRLGNTLPALVQMLLMGANQSGQ